MWERCARHCNVVRWKPLVITKLVDPTNLITVMETNHWHVTAKDTNRVAHSYKMRMWGAPRHTYSWGQQGFEPELGTTDEWPIFATFQETTLQQAMLHNTLQNQGLAVILEEIGEDDPHDLELDDINVEPVYAEDDSTAVITTDDNNEPDIDNDDSILFFGSPSEFFL